MAEKQSEIPGLPRCAEASWGARLHEHQGRLLRMVAFRLDPRLQGRVDAADILQSSMALSPAFEYTALVRQLNE